MLLKLGYEKLRGTCTNLHTKLADDWIFLKHILFSTVFICTFALLWPHFGVFRHIRVSRKKRIGLSSEEGRVSTRETLSQKSEQESDFWVLCFTKYMNSIHDESFFVCVWWAVLRPFLYSLLQNICLLRKISIFWLGSGNLILAM